MGIRIGIEMSMPQPTISDHTPPAHGWGPYEMRPSSGALLRVTLGSSVAVATALAIPDAFAILPSCPDGATWALRTAGLWAAAYIEWSLGFLAILHLTRIIAGGIQLDKTGLRLSRFSKKISWQNVVAASIIDRESFSRMLLISPVALELTLYLRKPAPKTGIDAKKIPSFQYSPEDFASLVYYTGKYAFGIEPASVGTFLFQPDQAENLRKISEEGRIKKLMLHTVIACSLVLFLARNAATNYTFNMGNVYSRANENRRAAEYYSMATNINPYFPPAWDRLARSEMRAGDSQAAMEHWTRALEVKPDFVESKLGLSEIYMRRWELAEAEQLILKSTVLARKEIAPFLNLAHINSLKGNHRQSIQILKDVLQQNTGRDRARCLLAMCYIRTGELDKAKEVLPTQGSPDDPHTNAFRLLIQAELYLASGNLSAAESILKQLAGGDKHVDLLLVYAKLKVAQGDYLAAEKMLSELERKQGTNQVPGSKAPVKAGNPWVKYLKAKIAFGRKDKMEGQWQVEQALKTEYPDPTLLAACAELLLEAGVKERAMQLIEHAEKLDATNLHVKRAREVALKSAAQNGAKNP